MVEMLFECGVCNCIYRISMRVCPRCGATNESRKKYHGGFYDWEVAMQVNEYQEHNSHYNVNHMLKCVAWDGVIRRD
jgi:hypothetical protein